MVDRLTHKAHLINMNGKSYRTKETLEWLKYTKELLGHKKWGKAEINNI